MGAWWSYRVRRRCAGPLAACALMLTASCALGSAPDRSVPAGTAMPFGLRVAAVRVLQLNLCNSGVARCYTGGSVAEAVAVLRAEAPDVVTLNEVCAGDVPVLEHALADVVGATVSAFRAAGDRRTGEVVHCRNGQQYGIGLIVRRRPSGGGGTGGGYAVSGGVYPVQPTRSPEQRAWLCLSPSGGSTATAAVVCTTHLSSGNPTVAGAQCAYLMGTAVPAARARARSLPLVLAGDLNLRAGGSPDVRSCVPADDRWTDDGAVQHVVATPEFAVGSRRTIGLTATDHPGLLVTLVPAAARPGGPQ
jgi:Endonuclease/Exonuclease/phosphatase family